MTISTTDTPLTTRLGSLTRNNVGPVLFVLLIIAATVYFSNGLIALGTAWQVAEYSHGPIIPLLSSFLFLRKLKMLPPPDAPVHDRWHGVFLIVLALMLGLAGNLARIPNVVAYSTIGFVAGLVLVSFGLRRGLQFWPSVLHLVFMLPLPGLVYWQLSTTLQLISSEFGVWLIRLAGVPVFLDGNIIDLGVYKLHVAEACSGLRYLFPILSFSYVFATLYRGPAWHKAVLLLSAAPITVIMNSVRIGIVGLIVDRFGIEHAEGISHFLEGWVIFITCVLMLFGLARLMLAFHPSRMSLSEALDLELSGLGEPLSRWRLIEPSAALKVSLAITTVAAIAWHAAPERTVPQIERQPFATFEARLDDWSLVGIQNLDPAIETALGADDYMSATFARPGSPADIEVFLAWYEDQTEGGIHSPEVCLPMGGWEMASIRQIDLAEHFSLDRRFPVNRAVIQKGQTRLMVYYWFEQYAGRTAIDYVAKAALLYSSLVHGRSDGALVRLITPIRSDETDQAAEDRLLDMVPALLEQLPRFVPQHDAPAL